MQILPAALASESFDTGPEKPELEGSHKGIQQVYALSIPGEKSPIAAP